MGYPPYYPPDDDRPAIDYRWELFKDAPNLIYERFNEMKGAALSGYKFAEDAITCLKKIGMSLAMITTAIAIDTTVISGELPDRPEPTFDPDQYRFDSPPVPLEPTGLIPMELDPLPPASTFPELVGPGNVDVGPLAYTSTLMTQLQSKILNDLAHGGTGIAPDVEDAIFKRNYERDLTELDDEIDRTAASWAKGGFPYPNGGLRAAQDRVIREFSNKRTDVSRDVMIKSWEMAFQYTQFVVTQSVAIESLFIRWAESVATRIFEASKATIDANLRTYELKIKGWGEKTRLIIEKAMAQIQYNLGLIRMFEARVNAYAAKMNAEAARINAIARGDEAEVNMFNALVNYDVKKIDVDLKVISAKIEQAVANANILLKNKDVEIREYEALKGLKIEAEKAVGSIAAQLAAGALSAVHAQVSIGSSDSADYYYNPNQVPTED